MNITIKPIPIFGATFDFIVFNIVLMSQYSYNTGSIFCWLCLILMTLSTLYICSGVYKVLDSICYYRLYDKENEQPQMNDEGSVIAKKGCRYIATAFVFLVIILSLYHSYLTRQSGIISFAALMILIHRILIEQIYQKMLRRFITN